MSQQLTVPRFSAEADEDAFVGFRRAGVVVFDGLWQRERIAALHDALERHHPEYVGKSEQGPLDIFETGQKRFLSPLAFAPPFDCTDLFLHPALMRFFTRALGPNFVFEAIGVLSSLPGAEEQHLHSDGLGLFEEVGLDRLLPNVALTVVIPLVRIDEVSGRTAFWPGSHLHRNGVDPAQFVAPELEPGACAIWDFRLRHRGMANKGDKARPLLYMTVCRPFWIDHQNFVPGVNAKLLASRAAVERLPEVDRKRFMRATFVD